MTAPLSAQAFEADTVPVHDALHLTGGGVLARIVLSGHTDVVPAGDPATWTRDPLSGAVAGGELHGRGSCDM